MHVLTSEIDNLILPAELSHRESILTVGSFDGIHVGHQALIHELVTRAQQKEKLSGLVTFYPHPSTVIAPQNTVLYLTTPGEKTALLEPLGLDWAAILPFTPKLAATSPQAFVKYLYDRVNMRSLWVGPDFALGHKRAGDLTTLRRLGHDMGFQVHQIPYVTQDGTKVSSSHIRTLIRRGYVQEAAHLLGRYYTVAGEVVHGAQRGRCMGFPTANIDIRTDHVIPANGIYVTYAYLGSERFRSVTSIGVRPSFDNGARSIEAYLLDFQRDIYGCDLVLSFVARLRPERRYPDVKDLVAQIHLDVEQTRETLDQIESAHSNNSVLQTGALLDSKARTH